MARRLLHLSDLHLNAQSVPRYGIDAHRSLELVLEACGHIEDLAAVVVTGDIADDGSVAAYERARETLLEFSARHGAHLVFCTGNHDERGAFSAVLGSGHLDATGQDCGRNAELPDRVSAVSVAGDIRVITLDTLVSGKWYGHLGAGQLAWLERLLADEADLATVLAFHHPPVDVGVEIQRRAGLQDRDELATLLRRMRAAAILCGHFHQQIAGSLSGVPTWVTPGVFTRIDHLSGPVGTERAVAGGSATLVDLAAPAAPLFAIIAANDPNAGRPAYQTCLTELEEELSRFGIPEQPKRS